jgi:hypothetical protein
VIVEVFVEDVDFPECVIRVGDPELRLPSVTALHALLALGMQSGGFEALLDLDELLAVSHAQSDVIQGAAGSGVSRNQ